MTINQMCEKLLCNMDNLYFAATKVSTDLSPVKMSDGQKYSAVCQGAISSVGLMRSILRESNFDKSENFIIISENLQEPIFVDYTFKEDDNIMRNLRLLAYSVNLYPEATDKKMVDYCANVFDRFEEDFMGRLEAINNLDRKTAQRVIDSKYSLAETIAQPKQKKLNNFNDFENNPSIVENFLKSFTKDAFMQIQEYFSGKIAETEDRLEDKINKKAERLETKVDEISVRTERVENKLDENTEITKGVKATVDDIYIAVRDLNEVITNLQESVTKQLETVNDDEEEEKIIAKFCDQCVENIMGKLEDTRSLSIYDEEENNLKELFEDSWSKMSEESQSCLVTAQVLYNQLILEGSKYEFSGACVSVTKALEIELKRRFYFGYLDYLRSKYAGPNSYDMYPKNMMTFKGNRFIPWEEKQFTLGKISHILREYFYPNINCWRNSTISDEYFDLEKRDSKKQLIDFCKDTLFSNMDESDIWSTLQDYAKNIHRVALDYRNPATHTGALRILEASECFDYMLYVTKFIKTILDSFDY